MENNNTNTNKPAPPIFPLIVVGLVIVLLVGAGLYVKFGGQINEIASSSNKTIIATNQNTAFSPTPLPQNTPVVTPTVLPQNTNVGINYAPPNAEPTVDREKEKQKGADLRRQLEDFLKDSARDVAKKGEKWTATKTDTYYADIDNDGLEDAVFRFTNSINESDIIWLGFVVFRNTPDKYVYVDKDYFGAIDQIDIINFDVKKGGIKLKMKKYEESTMGEDEEYLSKMPFTMVNKTFIIRDNRLQEK
jgi:hypothetical protein